ncbi:MAG: nitrate reductase molybdenum cofactor assembly chaperone [Rickettsiales bacterium]
MQSNINSVTPAHAGFSPTSGASIERDSNLRGNGNTQYKTFKALGIFLCYPNEDWLAGGDDLCALIEQEKLLSAKDAKEIRNFIENLSARDLLDAQEEYVDLFDRVRSLSLHLFEHVHGESRDRGQAMVDLAERYKESGFALSANELPDYLPVFLEYLSSLPKEQALEEIADTSHILVALGKKLAESGSPYSLVFNSLIHLAGSQPAKVEKIIKIEPISFAEMDKEWEDKPIDFMGAEAPDSKSSGGCSSGGCSSGGCGSKTTQRTQGACS